MKFRNKKTGEIIDWDCTCINSSLLSAQNRKRLYWVNFGNDIPTLLGKKTCDIPLPKDKGILLKDILESGIAPDEKSRAVISSIGRTTTREYFKKNQGQMVAEPICVNSQSGRADGLAKQPSCADRIYDVNGKSVALSSGWKQNIAQPVRLSQYEKSSAQAQKVYSVKGKSVTLLAGGGGQGGKTGLYKIDLPDGDYIIRKLSPVECERLQTFEDGYTSGISNSQRYKCIGNSWTVDVIAYIFSFLKTELDK